MKLEVPSLTLLRGAKREGTVQKYSWRSYADASTTRKMKTRAMPDVIVSWRRAWESPSRTVLTEVRREKFNSNHTLSSKRPVDCHFVYEIVLLEFRTRLFISIA